ncbi:MAG: methyltransferase [Desulfobacterales bacterium]|nr:methyltransferase [Desulfobacterales bacterium]
MSQNIWAIGRILETAGTYWQICTLHTGVKLNVFTVLDNTTLPAQDVAREISGDLRGIATLLDALCAMGLLHKSASGYANTQAAATWLSCKSPQYVGHIILHHHHLMEIWERLDEAVLTGGPVQIQSRHAQDEKRESFLMGMFNLAMNIAPRITEAIDLSSRAHLLDLGGGPGTYAIHFCKKNKGLKASIVDLPTTRPFAEKTIASFGLADRIDFIEGNFLEEAIPGTYDAAWLSHILHGEGPADCQNIIQKVVSVLRPGGMIMIHEFMMNNRMDGPLFPALFSLNMLCATETGRAYSQAQLSDMLSSAGVINIRRVKIDTPNDSGILLGTLAKNTLRK